MARLVISYSFGFQSLANEPTLFQKLQRNLQLVNRYKNTTLVWEHSKVSGQSSLTHVVCAVTLIMRN